MDCSSSTVRYSVKILQEIILIKYYSSNRWKAHKSPDDFVDFIFKDFEIIAFPWAAESGPGTLAVIVQAIEIKTGWEISDVGVDLVALIVDGDVSPSENRAKEWDALDCFLRSHQGHLLLKFKSQDEGLLRGIRHEPLRLIPSQRRIPNNSFPKLRLDDGKRMTNSITNLMKLTTLKLMFRCPKQQLNLLRTFQGLSNKVQLTCLALLNYLRVNLWNNKVNLRSHRFRIHLNLASISVVNDNIALEVDDLVG